MTFTGKATYSAGTNLPEIAEDVSDILGIISPYETPLLDHLGDPQRAAHSTIHEWLEDALLPNTDLISDPSLADDTASTQIVVNEPGRFLPGAQLRVGDSREVLLVTAINANQLTVVRGYGSTTPEGISDGDVIHILGGAALEGDDAPAARFTSRVRQHNYTQIFTAAIEISGSQLAARQLAVADELDYQKQERLRELLRDLENCVINGVAPAANPQGSATVRRTMNGIRKLVQTHVTDAGGADLTEAMLNQALRDIWSGASARVDTIVVGGLQKRKINGFITASRGYGAQAERFKDLVSVYESDFGVCRVLLSRWVPADTVLLLDSSRIDVLPLAGRSFHYQPLARTGDRETGQLVGEYTLELRNESAHGLLYGLKTT